MRHLPKLLVSISIPELVGIISTSFTIAAIPTWYATLTKPFFSPPNWVFGHAWTILYGLMGISAYLVWMKGIQKKKVKEALTIYGVQLVLNFFWSLIFFGLRQPLIALAEIMFLWVAIAITIVQFYKISKPAAYLLIPYLLWVSFASLLNLFIVILN